MSEDERFKWHGDRGVIHLWDNQLNNGTGGYVASIHREGRTTWHYYVFSWRGREGDSGTVTSVAKYKAQRLVEVLVRML